MRLIDADALLQTLSNMCCADNNVKTRQIVDSTLHNLMPQIISDEPTIETHSENLARWIVSSDGYYPYCSNCGARPQKMTKFCAECGCKMRKEVNDETD